MICFQLYATSRALTNLYRPVLDELSLTYPQFIAMVVLWEQGPATMRDLGRILELDSGTLSPLIKRLESQGFVRRVRGTTDERTVEIHLTDEGTHLRRRVEGTDLMRRFAAALDLELDEYRQLHDLLSRVRASATVNTL
nr:MarR family transcriptional regulator [uncultured Actinoplanes sp.]